MKKIILFFLISILLIAVIGCVCGTQQTVTHDQLKIAYDKELTRDLLAYFQTNQDCIVTGVLLNEETDYEKLAESASVALVKDEAVAEKLRAAGWTETADWSDAQKDKNQEYFGFIVMNAPERTENVVRTSKLLTNWLVGDGEQEKTLTSVSGCGCGCSTTKTNVKIRSDAPDLAKSEQFKELVNN